MDEWHYETGAWHGKRRSDRGNRRFLSLGQPAFAEQVSRQQILEALTVQPKATSFSDRLRLTRSMTFNDRDYEVASTQSKPAIDLEVNFDFNSAAITARRSPNWTNSVPRFPIPS